MCESETMKNARIRRTKREVKLKILHKSIAFLLPLSLSFSSLVVREKERETEKNAHLTFTDFVCMRFLARVYVSLEAQ